MHKNSKLDIFAWGGGGMQSPRMNLPHIPNQVESLFLKKMITDNKIPNQLDLKNCGILSLRKVNK